MGVFLNVKLANHETGGSDHIDISVLNGELYFYNEYIAAKFELSGSSYTVNYMSKHIILEVTDYIGGVCQRVLIDPLYRYKIEALQEALMLYHVADLGHRELPDEVTFYPRHKDASMFGLPLPLHHLHQLRTTDDGREAGLPAMRTHGGRRFRCSGSVAALGRRWNSEL